MRIISGCARGRHLKTRKGSQTRPTADRVKESIFNMISGRLPGARFLDIFAGNGGVGIEALSRGAEKCVFIEKNTQCVKIIKDNLQLCGLDTAGEVWQCDAANAFGMLAGENKFDLIFLDPPYHSPVLSPVLDKIASNNILSTDGLVIVEHHQRDRDFWNQKQWQVERVKKYGDTVMTFLVPAETSA